MQEIIVIKISEDGILRFPPPLFSHTVVVFCSFDMPSAATAVGIEDR